MSLMSSPFEFTKTITQKSPLLTTYQLYNMQKRLNERPILAPMSATFVRKENISRGLVDQLRRSKSTKLKQEKSINDKNFSISDQISSADIKLMFLKNSKLSISAEWLLATFQMFTVSLILLFALYLMKKSI